MNSNSKYYYQSQHYIYSILSQHTDTSFLMTDELVMKTLCYDYCSMTSACLYPNLSALQQQKLSRATNKQPNKTENLIPALHFSQFWFMTCCCLFPQPKSFQTPDWFSPESLFVCCWQPPVCASAAVLLSTGKHAHTHTHTVVFPPLSGTLH